MSVPPKAGRSQGAERTSLPLPSREAWLNKLSRNWERSIQEKRLRFSTQPAVRVLSCMRRFVHYGAAGLAGRSGYWGRDISPAAIAMCEFALRNAADWASSGEATVDVRIRGRPREENASGECDPHESAPSLPGRAWALGARTNAGHSRSAAGRAAATSAWLSSRWRWKALRKTARLERCCPQACSTWRQRILESRPSRKRRPSFCGNAGEYGLFAHALVQVAAMVIASPTNRLGDIVALVTSQQYRCDG